MSGGVRKKKDMTTPEEKKYRNKSRVQRTYLLFLKHYKLLFSIVYYLLT